jgi:hypothetical protein
MCFFQECAARCGRKATERTTVVLAPDLVLEVGLCPLCTVIAADVERRRAVVTMGQELALEDLNLGGVPVIPLPVRR